MSVATEKIQPDTRNKWLRPAVIAPVITGLLALTIGGLVGDLNGYGVGKKAGVATERAACIDSARHPRLVGKVVLNSGQVANIIDSRRTVKEVSPTLAGLLLRTRTDPEVTALVSAFDVGTADASTAAQVEKLDDGLNASAIELAGSLSGLSGIDPSRVTAVAHYVGIDSPESEMSELAKQVVTFSSQDC